MRRAAGHAKAATEDTVTERGEGLSSPMGPERSPVVARFERNRTGRDFVVGDIHGMFPHLRALLTEADFDEERDRLFSVGDLIDRGPESTRVLEWLGKPWFHACRGNHEQLAIDSLDPEQLDLWVNWNGGGWWLDLAPPEQDRFRRAFARMPLAMEVETRTGTVGIVHADVAPLLSWDAFMDRLKAGRRDAVEYAIWSRNRLSASLTPMPVTGRVDRVYCGHTPVHGTVRIDNVYHIDTGAVFVGRGRRDARLTMVEIHPERHREYAIETARRV